ncbi:MAG: hypothetical protein M3405_04800 [Acidobacteriota bacterium]|jgi:hypothetical protein|nr:hypothetical protein [Acidobacteriota bacterium]
MRKIFNPTVLILTFSLGVLLVTAWLFVQDKQNQKPKIIPPIANDLVANSNSEDEESYAVYSALIENISVNQKSDLIVIEEETTGCKPPFGSSSDKRGYELIKEWENQVLKKFTDLSNETLHNFQNKRKHCDLLKSDLDASVNYILVSEKEIDFLIDQRNDPNWGKLSAKYPNSYGFNKFSKIGFNREMTQALVYTEHSCGSLCGETSFVWLRKKNNIWIVEENASILVF